MRGSIIRGLITCLVILAFARPAQAVAPHELTFDEAWAFTVQMAAVYRALPPLSIPVSQALADAWVLEITPFFEEVGIASQATYPASVDLVLYPNAFMHLHVEGTSDCGLHVTLNGRMALPTSAWYGKLYYISTLAHELVHQQQGVRCQADDKDAIEVSAQIGMDDVLAAMSNGGNRLTFYALSIEMLDQATGAAEYEALIHNRTADFWAMLDTLFPDPMDQARFARARVAAATSPYQVLQALYRYEYEPANLILTAHRAAKDVIPGLIFEQEGAFTAADLGYWLDHALAMAHQIAREPAP